MDEHDRTATLRTAVLHASAAAASAASSALLETERLDDKLAGIEKARCLNLCPKPVS